jgi:hypothetical protein
MSSIETELWNIYTYYTLHGNPRDPAHIQVLALWLFLSPGSEFTLLGINDNRRRSSCGCAKTAH